MIGSDGRPTPVLGVFPQGRREVFRVRAGWCGDVCCGEHLWFVTTPDDRKHGKAGRVVETREMVGRLRHTISIVSSCRWSRRGVRGRAVPMDPYALGLLLGDGCLTTSTTPSSRLRDPELAVALEAALDDIELGAGTGRRRPAAVDGGRGGVTSPTP